MPSNTTPPPSPPGYDTPRPLPRPWWLLEGIGLGLLVVLVALTGLHERLLGSSDDTRYVVVVSILVLAIVHEGCHYVASRAVGLSPAVDLLPPRIYTTDRWTVRRTGIITLASPFVGIGAVGLVIWFGPGPAPLATVGQVVVVINTAVSGGDLYAVAYLLAKPPGTMTIVVRTDAGLREYVAEPIEDGTQRFAPDEEPGPGTRTGSVRSQTGPDDDARTSAISP